LQLSLTSKLKISASFAFLRVRLAERVPTARNFSKASSHSSCFSVRCCFVLRLVSPLELTELELSSLDLILSLDQRCFYLSSVMAWTAPAVTLGLGNPYST